MADTTTNTLVSNITQLSSTDTSVAVNVSVAATTATTALEGNSTITQAAAIQVIPHHSAINGRSCVGIGSSSIARCSKS